MLQTICFKFKISKLCESDVKLSITAPWMTRLLAHSSEIKEVDMLTDVRWTRHSLFFFCVLNPVEDIVKTL